MRIAGWIPKATDTHSEYVVLRFVDSSGYSNALQCDVYTYSACLVTLKVVVRAVSVLFYRALKVSLSYSSDGNRSCANW